MLKRMSPPCGAEVRALLASKLWRARSATEPAKDRSGWKSSLTGMTRAMVPEGPRGTGHFTCTAPLHSHAARLSLAARRLERRPFRLRIRAREAALEAADRLTQAGSQSRQLRGPEEKQRQRQHHQDLSDSESHRSSIPVLVGLPRPRDYSQGISSCGRSRRRGECAALLSSFLLILLAELPDKTLYTVLLLATRNRPGRCC